MSRQLFGGLLGLIITALALVSFSVGSAAATMRAQQGPAALDRELQATLQQLGFTGRVEATLEQRLGRPLNQQLATIGRLLWFDPIGGLNGDNTCAGCHSPTNGFGDTQSIAIGIDNNRIVGPDRAGPRNMRRAPMVINSALYPSLMWNARFVARSGNPFDNSAGFEFPAPEGMSLSSLSHLLVAQAFIPPTERTEAAGFAVPGDSTALRAELMRRLNEAPEYRKLFGRVYPTVRAGAPITIEMFAAAIAEFEFTLTFANAPIDRYARGDLRALTLDQKRGALLFFDRAGCVSCHSVSGPAGELFSDFHVHSIGVPQIAPSVTNNAFDGPGANEDFGREQVTGNPADRYMFRTTPLRNIAVQPAFMHNGAYTSLEDAIRHHLNVAAALRSYTPQGQGLDADLTGPTGPSAPLLEWLDPLLRHPTRLSEEEFRQLVAFVRNGLLDPRARPERLRPLIPERLPSGLPGLTFVFP